MAVRAAMAALILRVRSLVNDPTSAVWTDQQIQDVMDSCRLDLFNDPLRGVPTFSGSTILYLDYFHPALGDFEDDYVLKQFLTVTVTPASVEPIVGHFVFAQTTLPPVAITGKSHDPWRSAADLLERQAAQWALSYTVGVDGQTLARSQVLPALLSLAKSYRAKQRPVSIEVTRGDLAGSGASGGSLSLAPGPLDYFAGGS